MSLIVLPAACKSPATKPAPTPNPENRVDKVEIIIYMGNSKTSGLELLKAIPRSLVSPVQPAVSARTVPPPASVSNEILLFNPYDKGHEFIELEIRRAIRKPSGKLTQADLERVRKLNMPFTGSYLVMDITPLAKLKNLDLHYNQLTEVPKGLEKLTQLKVLQLYYNPALTKAQIAELQNVLPKCKIVHNAKK